MLQEVTVEYRDAANDRICEIHDEIEHDLHLIISSISRPESRALLPFALLP
jgi:hypothetical protein